MKSLAITAASALAVTAALASGDGDHAHPADGRAVGQPGTAAQVTRTVAIRLFEDDGRMGFDPASLEVAQGQTIRFTVGNDGALEHEIVFGTEAANLAHRADMAAMPDMDHADANALRLQPGGTGQILWTFTNTGRFQFACLIPGHLEAGMHGTLVVD